MPIAERLECVYLSAARMSSNYVIKLLDQIER